MASVTESIVREYFELHGFLVRQQRKYVAPNRTEEDDFDFLIARPQGKQTAGKLPFVLNSSDLPGVDRAIVGVRGWHTHIFTAATVADEPGLYRFAEAPSVRQAERFFGVGPILKLLVLPALPQAEDARARSIESLQQKGIDAVLPFRTLLADVVEQTEPNRNYLKSDLLQTIRLLKNYELLKDTQMDLFRQPRPTRPRKKGDGPVATPGSEEVPAADSPTPPAPAPAPAPSPASSSAPPAPTPEPPASQAAVEGTGGGE